MRLGTENLTYTYMPGTPFAAAALKGVTIDIEPGSFTALLGRSGSGKSTLIQHLNGLLKPTSGCVLVDGRPLGNNRADLLELRRQVGLVFQMPEQQFFAESVFDEIAFAPRNLRLNEKQVKERVQRSLELVGLEGENLQKRSPFHLSSGQKRLVAIASVLALQPRVLILDEPTAGLDPGGRRHLFSLLTRLNRRENLTVLTVMHHPEDVAALADQCLVLSGGLLALAGTPEEVFSQGEEMQRLGLALPPVTCLMNELNAQGAPVPGSIFTLEQARRVINHWLGRGEEL